MPRRPSTSASRKSNLSARSVPAETNIFVPNQTKNHELHPERETSSSYQSNESLWQFRLIMKQITLSRDDNQEEDDFKTWAHVQLLTRGKRNDRLWYAFGENSKLAKTSVTNGFEGAYNYSRGSRRVPLDAQLVEELAQSEIQIHIYRGNTRHSETDVLIAYTQIPMNKIVKGNAFRASVNLIPVPVVPGQSSVSIPVKSVKSDAKSEVVTSEEEAVRYSYSGTISVEVRPDANLQTFAVAGRLMEFKDLTMQGIPLEWRLPEPEEYALGNTVEAAEPNSARKGDTTSREEPTIQLDSNDISVDMSVLPEGAVIPGVSPTILPPGTENSDEFSTDGQQIESMKEACQNPEENMYRYVLEILPNDKKQLPTSDLLTRVTIAAKNTSMQSPILLTDGKLELVPVSTSKTEQEHNSDIQPDKTVTDTTPRYQWCIRWPYTIRFLPQPVVDQLRSVVESGKSICAILHRLQIVPVENELVWPVAPPQDGDLGKTMPCLPLKSIHDDMIISVGTVEHDIPTTARSGVSTVGGKSSKKAGSTKQTDTAISADVFEATQRLLNYNEPFYSLPSVRVIADDWRGRGIVEIPVQKLSLPGCTSTRTQANVQPVLVSHALRLSETLTFEEYEQKWEEYQDLHEEQVAIVQGDGAAKGKKGSKPTRDKKTEKKGKNTKKAKSASGKRVGSSKKGKKGDTEDMDESQESPPVPYFELYQTYINMSIDIDEPLLIKSAPPAVKNISPEDLVKPRASAPVAPLAVSASEAFRRDITLSIHAIAEQYVQVVRNTLNASEGHDLGTREQRRAALLKALSDSNLYHSIKQRLKQSISRIAKERFHNSALACHSEDDSVVERMYDKDGILPSDIAERDHFVSNLYTYLIGQLYRMLNISREVATERTNINTHEDLSRLEFSDPASGTPQDMMKSYRRIIHEVNRLRSTTQTIQDDTLDESANKDTLNRSQRLKSAVEYKLQDPLNEGVPPDYLEEYWTAFRISREAELWDDWPRATSTLQKRIVLCEKAAAQGMTGGRYSSHCWEDYAELVGRRGDLVTAAEALKQVISIDSTRISALLALGALELESSNYDHARSYLESCISILQHPDSAQNDTSLSSTNQRHIKEPLNLALVLSSLLHSTPDYTAGDSSKAHSTLCEAALVSKGLKEDETSLEEMEHCFMEVYRAMALFCLRVRCLRLLRTCLEHWRDIVADIYISTEQRADLASNWARLEYETFLKQYRDSHADVDEATRDAKQKQLQLVNQYIKQTHQYSSRHADTWRLRGEVILQQAHHGLLSYDDAIAESFNAFQVSIPEWDTIFAKLKTLGFSLNDTDRPAINYESLSELATCFRVAHAYVSLNAPNVCLPNVSNGTQRQTENVDKEALVIAKNIFMQVAEATEMAIAWFGASDSLMRVNELEKSEVCLNEARRMDAQNPVLAAAFARLCLLYQPERSEEAAAFVEEAVQLGLCVLHPRHQHEFDELEAMYDCLGMYDMVQNIQDVRNASARDKTQ